MYTWSNRPCSSTNTASLILILSLVVLGSKGEMYIQLPHDRCGSAGSLRSISP